MIPRVELDHGYVISRIIKGGWHLAGDHGAIEPEQARKDMARFVETGITTFDCADIYTGVEELIGSFRRMYPTLAKGVQVHTKFVPDLADLKTLNRQYVERIIDRSLQRLDTDCLDLVQFHWWDFNVPRYVETALELDRLRRAGKIARVGVTNFDKPHLEELLEAGIPIAAHQLQYSLIDDRPSAAILDCCRTHGIALLCYGTVCGGFLSERWLDRPDPAATLSNRSLIKYKLVIDDFGGWGLFQELLTVLAGVAIRQGTDIASVATRMMLDRPGIAAAIVGATNAAHLQAHAEIGAVHINAADRAAIESVTDRRSGPAGDVYVLERDRNGRHGQIMKYELNSMPERKQAKLR
jgi:aryl-alcohol dehydrogenase-like predicted oxidoreductase